MSHTVRRRDSHNAQERGSRRARRIEGPKRHAGKAGAKPGRPAPDARTALVTDHAVVRWLERVTGIDVGRQVREEILAEGRDLLIPKIGNGKLAIHGGRVQLQITAGRVTTIKIRERGPHGE